MPSNRRRISMTLASTTLLAEHVRHHYDTPDGEKRPIPILNGVDLRTRAGESLAIIGPSGAGKSTLLGLLAGLDTPSGGRIELLGQDLTEMDEDARARLRAGRVGFVFESFQLLAGLSALENVLLPLELEGRDQARERAREALDKVGLSQRLHHTPNRLSGGEQQRVALARAFASRPRLLFADEPTGNLDRDTGRQVAEILFELQRDSEVTLVLVTHDIGLAQDCGRRVELQDGRLNEQ